MFDHVFGILLDADVHRREHNGHALVYPLARQEILYASAFSFFLPIR